MEWTMDKITAIVLAAGKGSRMASKIPKQYMEVYGKPVLYYCLAAFEHSSVDEIVLVAGEEDREFCQKHIIEKYGISKVKEIVSGGTERYWSVKNGLQVAKDADYVLIHDGARPCVTQSIIEDTIEMVKAVGACTVGVPVKDTIKVVDDMLFGVHTPDRSSLWQIQTPQAFKYEEIKKAYVQMEASGDTDITDDTMILERYANKKTKVIMGDYCNIKITTPEDLSLVHIFLKNLEKSC